MSASSMTKSRQKQGIVTILGSDSERAAGKTATSLRRTLSADMSSRKWLSQHGFSPMKKIASSEELSNRLEEYSSSSSEEDGEEQFKKEVNAGQFDIWSSIVSQKGTEQDKSCSVPYIHPLVKKTGSSLSEKSLEVCTESLGSETGSDGFSSYPSSEAGDTEEDQQQHHGLDYEDVRIGKYNFAPVSKKSPPPSFPPPLPSLTSRRDGPSSLRMMLHRENGRLVLEAVSVPAQNNFRSERQDGRLVLTLLREAEVNRDVDREEKDEEYDQGFECDEDEDEGEEEDGRQIRAGEVEIMPEQAPNMSSGVIKLHRLALMMNRPASLLTKNPPWHHKLNEAVKSLPPLPPPVPLTAPPPEALFNAYDYCWRAKPTAAQAMEKNSGSKYVISKNNSSISSDIYYNSPESVEHYIVPSNLKGCKDHRRSLFREPYCITTT